MSLQAKLGAVVVPDITPPTTAISISGTKGNNDWYISPVTLTLTATDTDTGVKAIFYSLDTAATSSTTTSSFSLPVAQQGVHVLKYYSVDNAGNSGVATTSSFSVDTTPPEVQIGFSTSTKSIQTTGSDNLTSPTIATTASAITVADRAGNTLTLKTQQTTKSNYIALVVPLFTYSTGSTTNATTTLRYFWTTDKTGKYTLLISAIKTPTDRQVAIYTALTDKTYVITATPADDTVDLSLQSALLLLRNKLKTYNGLYIPSVATKQGGVVIK
jgi:hypothetical protein